MRFSRLCVPLLALLAACSDPTSRTRGQTLEQSPLVQPNRQVPRDASVMRLSFAPVVRQAAPAVVNVYSQRRERQQVDPFWDLFGGGLGVPRERIAQSLGSGVIVRADGVIVTNNHVIEGGEQIRVALADRREFPARVLLADPRADLAVLKIDVGAERLPVLPLAQRDDAEVGDLVLAIGDPFGVGQTVTNGIISALARTDVGITDFSFFIQTDAPINPGNSGGPLVDMAGNIIGINTAIFSRSGGSAGIGFAIPAGMVRRVVESALGGGRSVQRAWLGARTQTVDADAARSLGLDRPQGVLVAAVYPGSAAARAGIREGDLILAIDSQPVNDQGALNYQIATRRPGEEMRLSVRSAGGQPRTVTVRAETPPNTPARDERTLAGQQPLSGATVINLSPAAAEELGYDPFASGVLITKSAGVAAQAGFRPGDLVREVNGREVASVRDLAAAVAGAARWRMVIERDGQRVVAQF
jgi:Do/DeqQ family serine protease